MLRVLSALAPLAFLIVCALKTRKMADAIFGVGGCWVVMTIAVPVFVPLALSYAIGAAAVSFIGFLLLGLL